MEMVYKWKFNWRWHVTCLWPGDGGGLFQPSPSPPPRALDGPGDIEGIDYVPKQKQLEKE